MRFFVYCKEVENKKGEKFTSYYTYIDDKHYSVRFRKSCGLTYKNPFVIEVDEKDYNIVYENGYGVIWIKNYIRANALQKK